MADPNKAQPESGVAKMPLPVSDQIDHELARSAIEKRKRGVIPSTREVGALRRYESKRASEQRWQVYAAIPKGDWCKMSGRQATFIADQATRHNLPLLGATIDLRKFARAFHDFLAENKHKLASDAFAGGDELLYADSTSPALERYRDERAKMARLERLERERTLVDRAQIHEAFGKTALVIREAGARLAREFGPEAHALLNEALTDAEAAMARLLGGGDDAKESQSDNDNSKPRIRVATRKRAKAKRSR